jgi:hypothetical protein
MKNISASLANRLGFLIGKKQRSGYTAAGNEIELGNALGYPSKQKIYFHDGYHSRDFPLSWGKAKGTVYIKPSEYSSPHMVIAGSSGNGKSTLLKKLIYEISKSDINILLLDSDNEHYGIIKAVNGRVSYPTGNNINIFALDGLSAGERIQELSALLSDVFGFGYLQSNLLHSCMSYAYRKAGMRSLSQREMENLPDFAALIKELKIFIANSRTSAEKARLTNMLNKLSSLSAGIPSHNGKSKGISELFNGVVAVPLKNFGNQESRQILMHEILSRLYSRMHEMKITHKLSNYIVIDELDFVLADYDSGTGIIKKIVREGRKYGIGLIISTHMCNALPKEMVENSSCLITFNSKDPGERHYVASVMARGSQALEKFIDGEVSIVEKYCFILSVPEFPMPLKVMIDPGEARSVFNHVDYAIAAPTDEALKVPTEKESAIRMGFTEEHIEKLKESKIMSSLLYKGSEWLMLRNPSLSIEHEFYVKKISEWLSANGIRNYIIDNSTGPDIAAYPFTNKMAVEYETGRKSAYSTSRMIDNRLKDYDFVLVIVNDDAFGFYKSAIEKDKTIILSINEVLSA